MDVSPETLLSEAAKARNFPEEPVFLTGGGAQLLYSRLGAYTPLENIRLDPEFRRGKARELLEISKGIILEGANDLDSGPVYLRKSDAEQNRL